MRTTKTTTAVKVSFVDFAHCNAGLIKLLKVIDVDLDRRNLVSDLRGLSEKQV